MIGTLIRLRVNGRDVAARPGTMLLQACRENGIDIPTLCSDPRLKPASSCRLCEVEVAGRERSPCACATPVEEGMEVATHTPALEDFRRAMLTHLAERIPGEDPARLAGKPFRKLLDAYGVEPSGTRKPEAKQPEHPYLDVDLSWCVACGRCVRICDEVQGQNIWTFTGRGADLALAPGLSPGLRESACVSCGACADTCPTGAIEDVSRLAAGLPERWVRTTCPYCGTGCEMEVGVKGGRITEARPVFASPVSRGHLCVKGRYGWGFSDAPDRITEPLIRRNGVWEPATWDEALAAAASALQQARRAGGPSAVGVLASSRSTNEENYLTQKFARLALGTNNVDCCARVCHAPSAAGLGQTFGTGAATNSYADIERAGLLMVVGANPTENHPIVGARIRQRARAGVPLIVIDPRRTELADLATIHLAPRPGTNLPLLQAMASLILGEGLTDPAFLAARTEGLEAYAASLREWTPERVGALCGIEPEAIRRAARLYATTGPAMIFHGLGVTEQRQGTDGVAALAHLALLTGNVGIPGAGVNPLRGQNNVQGSAQMGCEPSRLTGYQKLAQSREIHAQVWGAELPEEPGLNALEMIDAAGEGRLKALLVIGYDPLLSHPGARETAENLNGLEALIVVDLFLTETAKAFGTVFLPAASPFEKEGTYMNGERRVQRVRQVVPPKGGSRTDMAILAALAERLGAGQPFRHPDAAAVWDEARQVWPAIAGISHGRLDQEGGLQWPCPAEDHPGTPVLHAGGFPGGRAAFRPLGWTPSLEVTNGEFPFLLNTGRSLFHFNAATMTGRTRNRELRADDELELHPDDAAELGLSAGDPVHVQSRHGAFTLRTRPTDRVRRGEPFATFHAVAAYVNLATGPGRDTVTGTPEYKVTAVNLRATGDAKVM
ncbi:formate dehydrogenase subunit alpha [Geothrix edaphica]|uniref:Formate dehydrogenase subunit alpha n=1 Tax=Geothrix edaphica TaxID=2927976 RepID=A0ABQ5Q0W4_9BACT|nr:formate dehydrogenase subunit alpha [Geothrix edaphica]GLH67946.1 formate dehydrogenase subunit alpha [Geothrix edaphica]